MVLVRFQHPDGGHQMLDVPAGASIMEGALNGGIAEILADCGGALSCATCHVYVADDWAGRLPPPTEAEQEMLEFAVERRDTSRLSCQLIVDASLDGLEIGLPERQQ